MEQSQPIQERKAVNISKANIEWFERTYGNNASLSWALDMLLDQFRIAHTSTPEDYAKIASEAVTKNIEDQFDG